VVRGQVYCYEDPKLLKLFSAVIRILYDADILDEDTIKFWYKKGSHPKVCFFSTRFCCHLLGFCGANTWPVDSRSHPIVSHQSCSSSVAQKL
jgi:eIF4-gamma/eIF5/eIF2-epsilon